MLGKPQGAGLRMRGDALYVSNAISPNFPAQVRIVGKGIIGGDTAVFIDADDCSRGRTKTL